MTVTVGDFIAFLALLISLYATWRTLKFRKSETELLALQKEVAALVVEKERRAARADLTAALITFGNTKHRLRVSNISQATAYDVDISFPDGNAPIIESEVRDKFPLEAFERGQAVDLSAAITMGTARKFAVQLTWRDDVGEHREKVVHVTL